MEEIYFNIYIPHFIKHYRNGRISAILKRYARNNNPIEVIFALKLKKFTDGVGIAFLYLFLINYKNSKALISFIIIIVYVILQFSTAVCRKIFLEPLVWILLICAKYGIFYDIKIFKFL